MNRFLTRRVGSLAALAAMLGVSLGSAGPAQATSATATLSAGSLAFLSAPPNVAFSATLTGQDQAPTTTQALDVGDASGSGAGWNITATSTTFTAGSHTLPDTATSIPSTPTVACDSGVSCTTAATNVSYPYSLPAATSAPTATKFFNATANSGMANQTVTPTWKLAVPAGAFAGNYSSTWTLSLVSGP